MTFAGSALAAGFVGALATDAYQIVLRLFADPPEPEVHSVGRDANLQLGVNQWFAGVVVPTDVSEGPPSRMDSDIANWADDLGGVAVSGTTFVLQITSPGGAVAVTQIVPRVLARSDPTEGRVVPPSGAGSFWDRGLAVDLDRDPPTTLKLADADDWSFPISIGNDDNLLIQLLGRTAKHTVEWCADIHYLVNGNNHVKTFPDESDPFVTTSTSETTAYWYWGAGWTSGPWP